MGSEARHALVAESGSLGGFRECHDLADTGEHESDVDDGHEQVVDRAEDLPQVTNVSEGLVFANAQEVPHQLGGTSRVPCSRQFPEPFPLFLDLVDVPPEPQVDSGVCQTGGGQPVVEELADLADG